MADFIITGKRKEFYNQMSCLEIKEIIGSSIYDSYYKFCFERNPYNKLVSLFYHPGGFNTWASIEEFIIAGELNIIKGFDQYTINKNVAVDDIFKFEEMDEALATISTKLNLDFNLTLLQVKLKSEFRTNKQQKKLMLFRQENLN